MSDWLFSPDDLARNPVAGIGGKAAGLLRLHQLGAPVPPWFVVPAGIPHTDVDQEAVFATLRRPSFDGIAVRSSALNEDGARRSHAGVYETVFIERPNQIADAIATVIASASRPGAKDYAQGENTNAVAVILQARVRATHSGTLFSAEPPQADPALRYVEIVNGAGHQLADATHNPTRVHLDTADGSCRKILPGKDGPETVHDSVVRALHKWAARIEEDLDGPVDIEWAWDDANFWLLQARPVTALHAHPARLPSEPCTSWFFDQRFNEPIRPLTRDTLLPVIADSALGDALRMRHCAVPASPLFFYAGQAYAPCRLYDAMLNGAPRWFLSTDLRQALQTRAKFNPIATMRYALHTAESLWRNRADVFRNLRSWDTFHAEVHTRLAEIGSLPEDKQEDWCARWAQYDALNRRFLQIHRWSILWADYWFRGYGLAKKIMPRRLRRALDAQLHTDLELPTVAANAALQDARRDPSPENVRHLLEHFGHRSPSLDYATPTWAELWEQGRLRDTNPRICGERPAKKPDARKRRGPRSTILFPLRRFLELREVQRFTWEHILAAQRHMILRAGEILAREHRLEKVEEVFFLKRGELLAARFENTPVTRETLRRRIHTHRLDRVTDAPHVIGITDPVVAPRGNTLVGIGASPGTVSGPVHILQPHDPYAFNLPDGVILVARALDPAWTPHLLHAKGVILERGGLLSHAAVLAREYRTPLIVGLENATQVLRNGDPITLNGNTGTVEISTP